MRKTLQKISFMGLLLMIVTHNAFAQAPGYPAVPLDSVNYVPMDSLIIADSLGTGGRASLTNGLYLGDTITVTGVVIADPSFTINGASQFSSGNTDFYIQSPDSAAWGGMNVFGSSAVASSIGITSVDTGYVIQFTGVLTKYGTDIMGNFELKPISGQTIGIAGIQSRPAPVEVKLSDLVSGDLSSGGKMYFDVGTKYKNSYTIIRNLTVKTRTQSGTGQWNWTVEDSAGNTISVYDPSKYFTGRAWHVNPPFVAPAPGSKLKYIRGILATFATYGYEIVPLYPGDVEINSYTPSITATGFSARRSMAFPTSSNPVVVETIAKNLDPSASSTAVDSAAVYYSVNKGSYTHITMAPVDAGDTLFSATIPPQADGSFVTYYFKAWQHDSLGNALQSMSPDTSRAPLFYYVRSNGYTIKDIQYTPFKDGNSGVADLSVTVEGTVQADSTDYPTEIDEENQTTKTPYAYMQDEASPWSGIMLYGSLANKLRRGDLVTVIGTVSMYNGMTEITVDSTMLTSHGNALYQPVILKTDSIGQRSLGDSVARKWQGVLVQYDSVHITNNDPDAPSYSIHSANGSFREYLVNDGSGDTRVDDDGSNTYSVDPHDTTWGFHIMPQGAFTKELIGIVKYKNSEYKLEPRTNSDFVGEIDAIKRENSPVPSSFALSQNYPNPFNPTTTIKYSLAKESKVSLRIYNILGQEVVTLVNQRQVAGNYIATFDASKFASGVYFYRLNAGSFSQVRKMLLLK